MTEAILLVLGTVFSAANGGRFNQITHYLPPKTATVLFGIVLIYSAFPEYQSWVFWLAVLGFVFGESTGWTIAMKAATGDKHGAYQSFVDNEESWWEERLGLPFILDHPYRAMFIRGVWWCVFLLPALYFEPRLSAAIAGILVAVPLSPYLGRKFRVFGIHAWGSGELYRGAIATGVSLWMT